MQKIGQARHINHEGQVNALVRAAVRKTFTERQTVVRHPCGEEVMVVEIGNVIVMIRECGEQIQASLEQAIDFPIVEDQAAIARFSGLFSVA